jgi:folate-binding protein YgfZ
VADIGNQYPIIDTGAGWHERTDRGRIRVEGRDRVSFLQALLTNDLTALTPAQGIYTAYLTPQGRMIADMRLYARPDHILADVPASMTAVLVGKLDALIFSEDVRVADATAEMATLSVVGRRARLLLERAFLLDLPVLSLPPLAVLDSPPVFLVRSDEVYFPAFDLEPVAIEACDIFLPSETRGSVVERLQSAGIEPVGREVQELLRIEAGRPAFGRDMDEHTIPLEAGLLDRAISLTKGCYVGQEVIVRVLHRGAGRVAKRLVRLAFDNGLEAPPAAGTLLRVDGRESGKVTSAARSPRLGRVVALGYLAREDAEAGRPAIAAVDGREWRADVLGLAG